MELSEHTKRLAAMGKAESARDLLVEAYGYWPTAEIRLSRERLEDALDELRHVP